MSKKNSLETRMKENYEHRAKTYLTRRVPVAIRIDGKTFHNYTKGFKRPYDEIFHNAMNQTTKYLCENIQCCKLGYTQSDEISLLLTDYDTITTEAWLGYSVEKICSVVASMATMAFNKFFTEAVNASYSYFTCEDGADEIEDVKAFNDLYNNYFKKTGLATFDARCFNIPEDDVTNYFICRQSDCTRNAIQMLGQTHFSHGELKGKSNNEVQNMLLLQKGINFNNMPVAFKRGVCCVKTAVDTGVTTRKRWCIDTNIPIFTQDREYIEKTFRRSVE